MTITWQEQIETGRWYEIDDERLNRCIDGVLVREVWYAPRKNREPMTTREQVKSLLEAQPGATVQYDNDWYANIRVKPAPKPAPVYDYPDGRKLDCGCRVFNKSEVMSASLGTSCSWHYDEMSG